MVASIWILKKCKDDYLLVELPILTLPIWFPYIFDMYIYIHIWCIYIMHINTSSTAQGGGGSFKNRKPIGDVGCCESGMAERSH